jgi:hypothetical protein
MIATAHSCEYFVSFTTEVYRLRPFFSVDSNRFSGCYSIPHWRMPPIRVLSIMACRTFHTVLNHFSFVHMPTFRLVDTAACLAFAICTVGGIRTGRQKWDYMLGRGRQDDTKQDDIDGPVPPGRTWESMYAANYSLREKDEDAKKVENWESGPIVRNEKTNMLVKVGQRVSDLELMLMIPVVLPRKGRLDDRVQRCSPPGSGALPRAVFPQPGRAGASAGQHGPGYDCERECEAPRYPVSGGLSWRVNLMVADIPSSRLLRPRTRTL